MSKALRNAAGNSGEAWAVDSLTPYPQTSAANIATRAPRRFMPKLAHDMNES
jgi:hypothetical protein